MRKALPIGVDNFENLITDGYYYIDKTLFIKELSDLKGKVNLVTRPRRFGKTLNLSMIRYFFEDTGNPEKNNHNALLFEGLKIMEAGDGYKEQMGTYQVINLTLKSAGQNTFESACYKIKEEIAEEFIRHIFLLETEALSEAEKQLFHEFADRKASYEIYSDSLKFLSKCLYKATGQKIIILIDEYDVPLANSYSAVFYDELVNFIRSLFESTFKANEYLQFAVIAGCLQISNETVFQGINNLNEISVMDKNYSEYFGFNEQEVRKALFYYEREARFSDMKEWYDGYLFGDTKVYNPWSVLKFLYDLNADIDAFPRLYWISTRSNEMVKNMIAYADEEIKRQIEILLDGKSIDIQIQKNVSYKDMNENGEKLWNLLYFTGYLTAESKYSEESNIFVKVCIPNMEVKKAYQNTIRDRFMKNIRRQNFQNLYLSIEEGRVEKIEEILREQLVMTSRFYDSAEYFYHCFLAEILRRSEKYLVEPNREFENGCSVLMLKTTSLRGRAFIIVIKISDSIDELETDAKSAVKQIYERNYMDNLRAEGYRRIDCYGISFCGKDCAVCYGGSGKTEDD